MFTEEFVVYHTYDQYTAALEVEELLKQHNIEYQLEESSAYFSPTFVTNNALEKKFSIKVKKQDFERVEELLQAGLLQQIDSIGSDYHLFEYSDDELMEIVQHKYEWNQFDFLLAQKILKERGKLISKQELETFKEQNISTLAAPEKSEIVWLVLGYAFAFLGGLLGIAIGWHLYTYKKILPTGDAVYVYSEADRKHGVRIFVISIIVTSLALVARFVTFFLNEG